jgi:protein SCO1/2
MNYTIKTFILSILFISLTPSHAYTEELGIYEKLDTYLPSDLTFTDENGKIVDLISLIDKPTVISLVYYECPGLCSPLLEGVADVITKAKLDLGSEYQVFTISFDPEEGSELAVGKKASYSELVENKDVKNGWKYFTGNQKNITKLLDALGYQIKEAGSEYIHPAAVMVLSPEAKITRYLHGTYFLPFDLKMAVVEAMDGKSGPTINKVLRYCFSYDPEGQKYVLNITKISGTMILILALSLFGGLIFKNKKNKIKKA